jgi:hypothetical protein
MRLLLALACGLFAVASLGAQTADWKDSSLVEVRTINEWCRHCPDWNKKHYSFRLPDGMTYVGETHKKLNVTLNGHTRIRIEGTGEIGDALHILDDSNKDQKLKIVEKIAKP